MAMIDKIKEYAREHLWEITTKEGIIKVEKNGIGTYKKFEITMDLERILQQMKDEDEKTSDIAQGMFSFVLDDDKIVKEGDKDGISSQNDERNSTKR